MQATTVKVYQNTKSALDGIREEGESYDDVIEKLLVQSRNRNLKAELIKGYKSQSSADLELLQEWEAASQEVEK